jgi:hypothetical protein
MPCKRHLLFCFWGSTFFQLLISYWFPILYLAYNKLKDHDNRTKKRGFE